MRKQNHVEVGFIHLVCVLGHLVNYIEHLLDLARQASSDLRQERRILMEVARVHHQAVEMLRVLPTDHSYLLPAIPKVGDDHRVLARCPKCGHENHENAPSGEPYILRYHGDVMPFQMVIELPLKADQRQYMTRAVNWKDGYRVHQRWQTLKLAVMSCGACEHRETALADEGLGQHTSAGERTTQHPEILLLKRWQVPEPRMAIFDRENHIQTLG